MRLRSLLNYNCLLLADDIGGTVQRDIATTYSGDNVSAESRDVVDSFAPVESLAVSNTGSTTRSGDSGDGAYLSASHADVEDTASAAENHANPITAAFFYGIFLLSLSASKNVLLVLFVSLTGFM